MKSFHKQRTMSYVMTVDPNSTNDMQTVEVIRQTVAKCNALLKFEYDQRCKTAKYIGVEPPKKPTYKRVSLKGRLGKNNPAASKYRRHFFGSVRHEDAQRFDVYIHDRRGDW